MSLFDGVAYFVPDDRDDDHGHDLDGDDDDDDGLSLIHI